MVEISTKNAHKVLRTCSEHVPDPSVVHGVIQHVSKIILVTIRGGNPDSPNPTDQQILPLSEKYNEWLRV